MKATCHSHFMLILNLSCNYPAWYFIAYKWFSKKKNPAFSLSKGIIYHARDALNIDLRW